MTSIIDKSLTEGAADSLTAEHEHADALSDSTRQSDHAALPDASALEDKTPEWFRMSGGSVLLTVAIGLMFLKLAFQPLWHTDLWDHINYGQHILNTGTVSQTEPLLALNKGVPMVNFPWLVQLGMAWTYQHSGLAALQFAAAFCVALMMGVIAWRTSNRGGSVYAGLIAIAVFYVLNRFQFMVVRPQLVGLLFYVLTISWTMSKQRHTRLSWIGMPLMFAVWANCHGSFSIGLTLMALTGAGRFLDVWYRSRSLRMAFLDRQFDRTFLLTQLCATAVLLNPAGLAIYREVLQISGNPNISSMFEWAPLTLRSIQGQWAAGMTLLLIVITHLSPRRIRLTESLPLIAMGLLALWSSRMINWWAPLMGIAIGVHGIAAVRSLLHKHRRTEPVVGRGLWTVINLGMCWLFFAFTHFGVQTVHGRTADPARLVSKQTPVHLVEYLNSRDDWPAGIAMVPAEWAGFVMNTGPASIRPMVNLHVHLIPQEVWEDYERLTHGPGDWDAILDQYGINMAIVDKGEQPRLFRKLAESEDWIPRYNDNQAVVLTRRNPI